MISLWPVYPDFLHEAFNKAFGDGLKDSSKRLTEKAWKDVLYKLLDNAVICPHCHEINFADMAQGGGKDALKIDDALAKVDEIVLGMLK